MEETIVAMIEASIRVEQELAEQAALIGRIARCMSDAIRSGHKILLCGNGGSAADAQHVAAEFVGRFLRERNAWPAIALTTDSSIVTALGNDYGFETIFARQVEALAGQGDVVVGISTSGKAANVLNALQRARAQGCVTIGFTGMNGVQLQANTDYCLMVPSTYTPNIQEAHLLAWHIICRLVEDALVVD